MRGLRLGLVIALLVAGVIELVVTIVVVTRNQFAPTLAALNLPSSFLPITLAVVFSCLISPGKALRATVAITAVAFAGVRLGLVVALLATTSQPASMLVGIISAGPTHPTSLGISVITATVLGLGLAGWAVADFVQPRSAAIRRRSTATTASQPSPAPGPWITASTPWPTSDDDDPQATVIRPHNRRRR